MKTLLLKYWDRLRSSFWFLPSLMTIGAALLAFASVTVDEAVTEPWLRAWGWAYSGGADGASAVLQTIAGSMITIAGVVFSLTLVALSLASSQFGPRLLRNFMRDTTNQLVLGTFISTFLYCLLVLLTIRRAAEGGGVVPHLSITLGVLFALASLGVLIYFIHHVSVSIQADEIVARVGSELTQGIERLFPQQIGHGAPPASTASSRLPETFDAIARDIHAAGDGYLQIIDGDALMTLAVEADALFHVERRPGQYVVGGMALVRVWPGERICDELTARVNTAFVLGNGRTATQDVEFAIQQLVEIASRALSPGVNDPFTAISCVDRLASALCRLAQREMPPSHRLDENERLRVVVPQATFAGLADAAFNQIRQYARANAAVSIRLLETIIAVAGVVRRPEDRKTLRRHAAMIARGARDGLPEIEDRRAVQERYHAVNRALREAEASRGPTLVTAEGARS